MSPFIPNLSLTKYSKTASYLPKSEDSISFFKNTTTGMTTFFWNDNFPVLYSYWDDGQPGTPTNEVGCVIISKGKYFISSLENVFQA